MFGKFLVVGGCIAALGFSLFIHCGDSSTSVQQYSLTLQVPTNGTVGKNPNQALYNANAVVVLTATAKSGYTFSGWSGDTSGTTNPLSVTMSKNKSITANFVVASIIPVSAIGTWTGTFRRQDDMMIGTDSFSVKLTFTSPDAYTLYRTRQIRASGIVNSDTSNEDGTVTVQGATLTLTSKTCKETGYMTPLTPCDCGDPTFPQHILTNTIANNAWTVPIEDWSNPDTIVYPMTKN